MQQGIGCDLKGKQRPLISRPLVASPQASRLRQNFWPKANAYITETVTAYECQRLHILLSIYHSHMT